MSFGSGGFGFGQQNQQSTGFGFGANNNTPTTGFGATSTFGSTSNTGTGLFGSNTGGSSFGAPAGGFGSTNTGFGAKPAFGATTTAGGGLFGSTTTATTGGFGSGGGFGAAANTTASPFGGSSSGSLFGATANKPAFGAATTGGGLFGSSNTAATSTFGTNTSGFGATANPGIGSVGDPPGTAAVPFQAYTEKETTNNTTNSFQSILFMDPYKKWSVEELRLVDYNQGRRFGNASGTGAFGVGTSFGGFGANNNTATNTSSGGLFGSNNNATGFGAQPANTTGGFGSTTNTAAGGLFGAKPATTGGLFGTPTTQPAATGGLFGNTGTGGFGTNTATTTGFGSNTSTGGGLFGNNAAQNKPADTGFGFGGTAPQTATGFGQAAPASGFGTNTASTGSGLFGAAATNTASTGGGLFGTATQPAAATSGFGSNTGTGFGAQPNAPASGGLFGQKPATGGLFGTAATNTAAPGATGGGLFGTAATNTASPFGGATNTQSSFLQQKPAASSGGLFGTGTAQPPASGGLFGNVGQNTQAQPNAQQGSLFGNTMGQNQQKPSLFGNAPAPGGSLFGQQPAAQQQTGSLFGTAPTQQPAPLGNSLFGNASQGLGLGASQQGMTTSLSDAGAYGAPSLFQNLATSEVQNPGPLATPLSNKTKTSRRSSILPLYKMNPGSASKFATPQKRGYGFSYSTFGTPNSASASTSSTPATSLNQSLLMGSVGRGGLAKSISSSTLRRTYNPEDSILLPGAFSASTSSRFYGNNGSNKKLVINRDMRSDLFSTPTKLNGSSSGQLIAGGSERKLAKRVSFDTATKDGVPETRHSPDEEGSGSDLGYLRPQARSTNGSASNTNGNGTKSSMSSASAEPEMVQVTGKELAIVHEEGSPSSNRCLPDNYTVDSKELGEYWMSPSKEEIEAMNRVQRQQVANFTVGRVNVGQVRFRVPVDLTKIDLDTIPDGIVTLVIRSATVYPDASMKPPVGQGLNVPAEIMLLHTCPRSGADVPPAKLKKHIMRLKGIPDTTFISYDEKTAAWTFTVEHFTTYGFDEDDDDTDAASMMTMDKDTTAAPASARVPSSAVEDEETGERRKRAFVPGAFDSNNGMLDDEDEEAVQQPFLSSRSAETKSLAVVPVQSTEYDSDMELTQDGLTKAEIEASYSLQRHPAAELDSDSLEDSPPVAGLISTVPETPGGVMRARMRAIKETSTPLKVQVADGDNWMEMLQKTVSPQKRDRAALKALGDVDLNPVDFRASRVNFGKKSVFDASIGPRKQPSNDTAGFATSIDLMNSLFEKAKAPPAKAPEKITTAKGLMKWPYKRQSNAAEEDEDKMDATERAYHESTKPAWSADGSCIVVDGQGDDGTALALKRICIFNLNDSIFVDDLLDNIAEHKDAVEVELSNGVPFVSTRRMPPIKAFAGFCEQANRQRPQPTPIAQKQGAYEQSVWELASVLFDPIDNKQATAAETGRARKESLSRFWAKLVQDTMSKSLELTQSPEEKAVLYLASHKIPEACRALVDSKNFKAATLVSLIGTGDAFKKDMREQMDDWQQGEVLAEFSVPLRAVYSLLAGNVAVCEGKKGGGVENRMDSVVLSDWFGLDWRQAFGLRLWYGIAAGDGVAAAVAKFVEDVEQGRVPQPRPWYCSERAWVNAQRPARDDLLYGLLKVAAGLAGLEDVLEPESAQPSPFRFRLGWQVNQALSAASSIAMSRKLSAEKADALTSAYAAEVLYHDSQAHGGSAWVHAIWVLMHLSDPTSRAQAIQDILGRRAGLLFEPGPDGAPSEANLYERLVEDLQIPATWVWQAAALYWRYQQKQPALEAECLLRASAYTEAHQIFVKELAPKAIVERNYGEIAAMLAKLQAHRHQISQWPLGGEVYSRFLDLLALQRGSALESSDGGFRASANGGAASTAPRTRGRQQQAKTGAEAASLQLAGAVEALVSSLPAMYENAGDAGPTEVAAITEMADVVAKETMALANKGRMDLAKISRLPLTEDRRLRYSTDLAHAYYREVMTAH